MRAPRQRGVDLGPTGPQLFLSHSSHNDAIVTRLAQNLNTCGVDVWNDAWELRVGDDLHRRIADAIDKSKFVGIALSRHFKESKWIEGEVHQALSREKAEDRTVVLPLLVEDVPLPPVLSTKKALDLKGDEYFPSLARLVGLIHDLPPDAVEAGIDAEHPIDVHGCVRVLRYCGFEPYCVVSPAVLEEVERAGGTRSGDRIRLDPHDILARRDITPALRHLLERLVVEWGSEAG